jgi:hypothetical protein
MENRIQKVANQQKFLTPLLSSACAFLEEQRERGIWGEFQEGPSGLYYSWLAIAALRSTYPEDSEEARALRLRTATIELKAKSMVCDKLEMLNMRDTSLFLDILGEQNEPDHAYVERLVDHLEKHLLFALEHPQRVRVRDFAPALVALSEGHGKTRLVQECIEYLRRIEKEKEGGWPAGVGGEPSIVATTYVLEALRAIDPHGSMDAIRRGERFLEGKVANEGWQQIGVGEDNFTRARVLQVLATSAAQDVVESGVVALRSAANVDGWGLGPQQPTTVEATASALLALAACGENRFVPYRTAAAQLTEVIHERDALRSEVEKLQRDFRRQVVNESDKILADRDKWKTDAQALKRKADQLEKELRDTQREAYEEGIRLQRLLRTTRMGTGIRSEFPIQLLLFLIFTLSLPTLTGIVTYFFKDVVIKAFGFELSFLTMGLVITEVLMASIIAFLVMFYFVQRQRRLLYSRRDFAHASWADWASEPVTSAVFEFADLMSQVPVEIREEINYSLLNHIVDMPRDVGFQFVQDFLERLKIPSRVNDMMRSWILRFLESDPFSRRAIAEQIRRLYYAK